MDPPNNAPSKPTETETRPRVSRLDPPEKMVSKSTQAPYVLPANMKAEDADPSDLIKTLKTVSHGFVHIASDGE